MLTRGHGDPLGKVSGTCRVSSVHGQPVRPGGGGGSSAIVAERMDPRQIWPEESSFQSEHLRIYPLKS